MNVPFGTRKLLAIGMVVILGQTVGVPRVARCRRAHGA